MQKILEYFLQKILEFSILNNCSSLFPFRGWSWKHPTSSHLCAGHGVLPTASCLPSWLPSCTPCWHWRLHPPSWLFPIPQDHMNSSAATFRVDEKEGGTSYKTRWCKTMKTSGKTLVPLTEEKVTLTIVIPVRECYFTSKERGTNTLLY